MLVGGGTSIMPRKAPVLYEWVGLDDGEYLKIAEAVFRIFDRQEWLRANRARARIKVFVDKYGIDELRRQVEEELRASGWPNGTSRSSTACSSTTSARARRRRRPPTAAPTGTSRSSSAGGRPTCVSRSRRASSRSRRRSRAATSPPSSSAGWRRSCASYSGGYARTTVQQNLVLRWVRHESAYDVWRALSELGLGDAGSREIDDVVSCPGTDSCKLGITSSMGLNQAVQERIEAMNISDPLTRAIHIKISGCPNGCGQHHVGSIGFTGASIKVGEHTIPAYIPHVGGAFEGKEIAFGLRLKARLPSKRVPDAVERWLRHYESTREEGEEWGAFVQRVGTPELEGLVKDLSLPAEFGLETMGQFIDWNRNVPFEVIRGEGECAV